MIKNRKIAITLTFGVLLLLHLLASIGKISPLDSAQLLSRYKTLLTPASFVIPWFWGVVYAVLFRYILFFWGFSSQSLPSKETLIHSINGLLIYTLMSLVAWVVAWYRENMVVAGILLLGVLYTLIRIARLLRPQPLTDKEMKQLSYPFELLMGWVLVLALWNYQAILVNLEYPIFSYQSGFITLLMLLMFTLFAMVLHHLYPSVIFLPAVIAGLSGLLLQHLLPTGYGLRYPYVAAVVGLCIFVLLMRLFKGKEQAFSPSYKA